MTQEAKSVNSIFELVHNHKANTGDMLALSGVLIERRGDLEFVLSDGKNGVRCFGQNGIELEALSVQNESAKKPRYDITGTWHGDYFIAYQANQI